MKNLLTTSLLLTFTLLCHAQIDPRLFSAICNNDSAAVAEILKKPGINVNAADENGATPMLWACYKAELPVVRMLWEQGAGLETAGSVKDTILNIYFGSPMNAAIGNNKLDVLQFLLEDCGADVNYQAFNPMTKAHNGSTPLLMATLLNQLDIIEYLLANKQVDLNKRNPRGHTALGVAGYSGFSREMNYISFAMLLYAGADFDTTNAVDRDILAAINDPETDLQNFVNKELLNEPQMDTLDKLDLYIFKKNKIIRSSKIRYVLNNPGKVGKVLEWYRMSKDITKAKGIGNINKGTLFSLLQTWSEFTRKEFGETSFLHLLTLSAGIKMDLYGLKSQEWEGNEKVFSIRDKNLSDVEKHTIEANMEHIANLFDNGLFGIENYKILEELFSDAEAYFNANQSYEQMLSYINRLIIVSRSSRNKNTIDECSLLNNKKAFTLRQLGRHRLALNANLEALELFDNFLNLSAEYRNSYSLDSSYHIILHADIFKDYLNLGLCDSALNSCNIFVRLIDKYMKTLNCPRILPMSEECFSANINNSIVKEDAVRLFDCLGDFEQEEKYLIEGLNDTFWLNYIWYGYSGIRRSFSEEAYLGVEKDRSSDARTSEVIISNQIYSMRKKHWTSQLQNAASLSLFRTKSSDFWFEMDVRTFFKTKGDSLIARYLDGKNEVISKSLLQGSKKDVDMVFLNEALNSLYEEFETLFDSISFSEADIAAVIISNLPNDEAAAEMIRFPLFENGKWTDTVIYGVLYFLPNIPNPYFEWLCSESSLSPYLANFNSTAPDGLWRGRPGRYPKRSTSSLYPLVWTRSLDSILQTNNIKTIWLSPDGDLHRIPFAALTDENGQYLGEKYQINTVISTRILADSDMAEQLAKPKSALLMGGMDYAHKPPRIQILANAEAVESLPSLWVTLETGRDGLDTPLPGTKKEVMSIDTTLTKAGVSCKTYTDSLATEAQFKGINGNSPDLIHIGTHGFYFTAKDTLSARPGESQFRNAVLPLFRSGLIFASAKKALDDPDGKGYPGMEDGICTAFEISQLDLSNTQLVVLSACQTGRGDIVGSEGVFGLQRAFKMAGARYVMMTLWNVNDVATAEFMEVFYKYWITEGRSVRAAFHQTQQDFIKHKEYKDPVYWAGFVLTE